MIFIINGERWCSLIEAVRRSQELNGLQTISYAPDQNTKYYDWIMCYPFSRFPWNGSLYNVAFME